MPTLEAMGAEVVAAAIVVSFREFMSWIRRAGHGGSHRVGKGPTYIFGMSYLPKTYVVLSATYDFGMSHGVRHAAGGLPMTEEGRV
jgi:hypothetical protein